MRFGACCESRNPSRTFDLRGLGFVAPKVQGCPPGSRPTGMIAASGFVDCADVPSEGSGFRQAPAAPKATATASNVITFTPTIQTQISPQISPAFVQQFQPTGSGVATGAAQGGSPMSSSQDVSRAELQRLSDQIAIAEAQRKQDSLAADSRQAALIEQNRINAQKAAEDSATRAAQAAQERAASEAKSATLSSQLQTAQAFAQPQGQAMPSPLAPVVDTAVALPAPAAGPRAGLLLLAAAGLGVLLLAMKKGKKR